MRIQSKFRDFYDYVGHRYGTDPGCLYLRGPLRQTSFDMPRGQTPGALDLGETRREASGLRSLDMSMIVAGLHAIPVIGNEYGSPPTFEAYQDDKHLHLLAKHRELGSPDPVPQRPKIPSEDAVKRMIRAVGAPVFRIRRVDLHWPSGWQHESCWRIHVDERVPILKDCGVPALVPAEQMWQSIYTVLTSVLRRDPDKEPPVQVGNDDRIEAAGFDLKTSFRHPVRLSRIKEPS